MKVRCKKFYKVGRQEPVKERAGLTIGNEYVVFCIKMDKGHGIDFGIIDDDRIPTYANIIGFEVISNVIPSNWAYWTDALGNLYLMPERWNYDSFFDDLEDYVPEAYHLFYEEADLIYQMEGYARAPRPNNEN